MLRLKVPAAYKVVGDLIFQQVMMALASFLPHESGEEPKMNTIPKIIRASKWYQLIVLPLTTHALNS